MKKIFLSVYVIFLSFLLFTPFSLAEDLTITTYYPAPYGVYDELRSGEYYGYNSNLLMWPGLALYDLVPVLGFNSIYYGVDPEAYSYGVWPGPVVTEGSFLRQLYIGAGYVLGGSNGWPLDERVALYVRQQPHPSQWNVGAYISTSGPNSFATLSRITSQAGAAPSYAVYADNLADGNTNDYTYGVKGITASTNEWGVGVSGEATVSGSNAIGVYAKAADADGRALIADGLVGIGTTNPLRQLHVEGNGILIRPDAVWSVGDVANIFIGDTLSYLRNTFGASIDQGVSLFANSNLSLDRVNGLAIIFKQDGAEQMRIDNGGHVGIGILNPNAALQVNGAISRQGTTLLGPHVTTHVNLGVNSITGTNAYSPSCTVGGGGDNQATMQGATVSGGEGNRAIANHSTVSGGYQNIASGGGCSTVPGGQKNEALGNYSFAAGRYARAKATDTGAFVWNDSTSVSSYFESNGANTFNIRAWGGIYVFSSGTAGWGSSGNLSYNHDTGKITVVYSSSRYKKNIATFAEDFRKILQVVPKSFVYKDSQDKDIGYIAEDFEKLGLKNLLFYDEEGKPNSIKYDKISLYALEIIKDQQKRIEKLEAEVNSLIKK